jgi:hypothetical protein
MALSRAQTLRNTQRERQSQLTVESGGASRATNWLFFWLVAGIMIAKDVLDLILAGISTVTAATGVGLPISVILTLIGVLATLTVSIIAFLYHASMGRSRGTKLMVTSLGMLLGSIPLINLLPEATLTFFAAAFAGNAVRMTKPTIFMRKG